MINYICNGVFHPTEVMQLPVYERKCKYAEDEIYGLMAASGIIKPPHDGQDMEIIWDTW
jgi:hypothetical protein